MPEMPQGKLLTFHSNMLSLLDASSERYTSHNDVRLTIFGNVHSKIRYYWYDSGLNDGGLTKVKPLEKTAKLCPEKTEIPEFCFLLVFRFQAQENHSTALVIGIL